MASRTRVSASLALILASTGCKVPEARSPGAPAPPNQSNAPSTSAPASDGAGNAPAPPASTAGPGGAPPTSPEAPAAPPVANERSGPPLPELRVKSFGLHVGGAAKDTDLRRDVQRTLERGFPRYLD